MLLKDKIAVIYGAGGAIGSAVAHAFAREGARVFLTGHKQATLDKVAADIFKSSRKAEVAIVDAMNQESIEDHASMVIKTAGSIDISFNAISLGDVQGQQLVDMKQKEFALPVINAMATQFFTATTAARHMMRNRKGVLLALTAGTGRKPVPNVGGWGVTCASIEGLFRQLAAELGSYGIRVICMRSAGSPDAPGVDEVFHQHAQLQGITREQFEKNLAERTLLKRLPRVAEIANAAVIMASDHASAITASMTNLTCGEIVD